MGRVKGLKWSVGHIVENRPEKLKTGRVGSGGCEVIAEKKRRASKKMRNDSKKLKVHTRK